MAPHRPLFHRTVLQREVSRALKAGCAPTAAQHDIVRKWHREVEKRAFASYSETQLEQAFLQAFFVEVLGYTPLGAGPVHNIVPKRTAAAGIPDFVLGTFAPSQRIERWRVVGELKGIGTNLDLPQASRYSRETPVQQAFRYALHGRVGTEWVVVSNISEIRLYRNGYVDAYHAWSLEELVDPERFNEFYVVLCCRNIAPDETTPAPSVRLLEASLAAGLRLTEGFYGLYDLARQVLLEELQRQAPKAPLPLLYGKAHKLLNRVLFAAFCEDHQAQLLPPNTIQGLHQAAQRAGNAGSYWKTFRTFFNELDKGSPPGSAVAYHAFNGGLFAPDSFIDQLALPDELFTQSIVFRLRNKAVSRELLGIFGFHVYDFANELDVDSLGAIFEQSLKDLPGVAKAVRGRGQSEVTRRATAGVFYTPEAVTQFLSSRALQAALGPTRAALLKRVEGTPIAKGEKGRTRRGKKLLSNEEMRDLYFLEGMLDHLRGFTLIDPACGSGAFLVAAFSELHDEYDAVNAGLAQLMAATPLFGLDKLILRNNLHGADLLSESVELSKLSIWLRTASATEPLEKLDSTIWSQDSLRDLPSGVGTFDVVLSNPPWGAELAGWTDPEVLARFPACGAEKDSYALFTIRGAEMLKPGGILAYVLPNSWLTVASYQAFRTWLLDTFDVLELVNVWKIFEDVNHDCCLLVARRRDTSQPAATSPKTLVRYIARGLAERTKWQHLAEERWAAAFEVDSATWRNEPDCRFETVYPPLLAGALTTAAAACQPLGDICDVTVGIQVYHRDKVDPALIARQGFHSDHRRGADWHPFVTGNDVQRYYGLWPTNQFILFSDQLCDKRDLAHYAEPRVLVQQIMWQRLRACFQAPSDPYLYLNTLFSCSRARGHVTLEGIAALLNSRVVAASYERWSNRLFGDKFPKLSKLDLARLPIPRLAKKEAGLLSSAGAALTVGWGDLRREIRAHREFVSVHIAEKTPLSAGTFWSLSRDAALASVRGLVTERASVTGLMTSWEQTVQAVDRLWRGIVAEERAVEELLAKGYGLPTHHYDDLMARVPEITLDDALLPRG